MDQDLYERLRLLFEGACGEVGEGRRLWVRSPGRTEIAGNHTDHQGGDVIAAAVTRYVDALVVPTGGRVVRVVSEGYGTTKIDLDDLAALPDERATTASLVRGMAALFKERGIEPAGFDAAVVSGVLGGSGLSSSAAFELMLGQAMNVLWADGALGAKELAMMAQRAEREWFGKPCGLMDQAAVALGGVQKMSFAERGVLAAERIDVDFAELGFAIAIVAVGADHAANTDDYAAVPKEMQAVASELGVDLLSEVELATPHEAIPAIRERLGDRAVLRAIHYYREMQLVEGRARALEERDMETFLRLTRLSGHSSAMYLQNVSIGGATEQPSMVAIAIAEQFLRARGAARVHGGGFGGTIQAFVPLDLVDGFREVMDAVFGAGATDVLDVDAKGARAQWIED